ncbi:MAG TPA: hypothetical protein VEB20_12110, partial [Azospirillaceae bacterium]|nr:hypothetical protein [Azospirillaceae bacterium]
MGWLVSGAKQLVAGDGGADALSKLLDLINDELKQGSKPLPEVLRTIASNAAANEVRELAGHFLGVPLVDRIADLRERLWTLEGRPDPRSREFGWTGATWSKSASLPPFALDVKAAGGAAFLIGPQGDGEPADDATVEFVAQGELAGEVKASVAAGVVSASAGTSASFQRGISYRLTYDDDQRVGRALADALRRIGRPVNVHSEVLDAFNAPGPAPVEDDKDGIRPTTLHKIRVTGGQGLGARAEGSLATPLGAIPGTLKIFGKAEFKLSRSFEYEITRAAADRLAVKAKSLAGRTRGAEVGVSYKLGISDLSPAFVKNVAKHLAKADTVLGKIDNKIGLVERTLLKPGEALLDVFKEKIKGALSDQKVGTVLGDLFGTGGDNSGLPDLAADWLGRRIDDLDGLLDLGDADFIVDELLAA